MELRTPASQLYAHARPIVPCAQCGHRIYGPDWSEYPDDCHARHLWSCESCGYQFETYVRFPPQRAA